jgi:hypothetical protein
MTASDWQGSKEGAGYHADVQRFAHIDPNRLPRGDPGMEL